MKTWEIHDLAKIAVIPPEGQWAVVSTAQMKGAPNQLEYLICYYEGSEPPAENDHPKHVTTGIYQFYGNGVAVPVKDYGATIWDSPEVAALYWRFHGEDAQILEISRDETERIIRRCLLG